MRILHLSLISILLAASLPAAATETDQRQYTVKQTEPSVGSNIRREIIRAGTVPLDKRYADLTPEQKASVKSAYESMKADDEPPFPANGLMPILKVVRNAHEQANLKFKGPLTLYVQVDSSGKATDVSVVQSPDADIARSAAYALMVQPYKPAVCSGQPCAMQYPFHVDLVGPEQQEMTTASGNPASGIMIGHDN